MNITYIIQKRSLKSFNHSFNIKKYGPKQLSPIVCFLENNVVQFSKNYVNRTVADA